MKPFKSFIIYISLLTFLTGFASCKKFLDVEPKEYVSDETTITDASSARTAVRGIYSSLASANYYGYRFQAFGYLPSEDFDYVWTQLEYHQLIQHTLRSDNSLIAGTWQTIYRTIDRANHVIQKVPGITNDAQLTDELKNQLIGEAYFIRALGYFDLARTFGGVQLFTEPTTSLDKVGGIPRSSVEETYAQVLSDLQIAEELLPNTLNRVRVTRKTVWALRARLHLYRQQWQEAVTYANYLLDETSNYALIAPYSSWFANNVVATQESIFELSYDPTFVTISAAHRTAWQPAENGGTIAVVPRESIVSLLNNPEIGGNRSTLLFQGSNGTWYGNLYYRSDGTDPAYLFRIAEQYLIKAEALAHLGELSTALENLNAVRRRAGLEDIVYNGSTTQESVLLAIENERRVEFPFEAHRWFDLVRTNRAANVLGVTDPNKYVFPIPLNDINTDPSLTQNPGY